MHEAHDAGTVVSLETRFFFRANRVASNVIRDHFTLNDFLRGRLSRFLLSPEGIFLALIRD